MKLMRALILSAGTASRLGSGVPKALTVFNGRSLLSWQLDILQPRATEIGVVAGFAAETFPTGYWQMFINDDYQETNMVASLFCASDFLQGDEDLLVAYGDILYEPTVIDRLVTTASASSSIVLPINSRWKPLWEARFEDPMSDAESLVVDDSGTVTEIGGRSPEPSRIQGQYMGILLIPASQQRPITDEWYELTRNDVTLRRLSMTDFLQMLVGRGHKIRTVCVPGGWIEFDTPSDLELYSSLSSSGRLTEFVDLTRD